MIEIAEIAETITEDLDLLDEAAITRRGFLKTAGSLLSHLTTGGLSPKVANNLLAMAAPSAGTPPRFIASIIAGTSGRYDPDVSDSFVDARMAYNTLRKLLGSDADIGATSYQGEEFYLGSMIGIKDIPRLLQSGKVVHEYSDEEDGTYIEIKLPVDQVDKSSALTDTLIISSEDNDYSVIPTPEGSFGPEQLIKVWWDEWEKWGSGNLSQNMHKLLRKNDIDPYRPNVDDDFDHGTSKELEDQDNEHLKVPHDYDVASPMHQQYESFSTRLSNALIV